MIRIMLPTDIRQSLQALRRDPALSHGERDRVETVMLSSEGWSPPRIASHLGCQPKTVRLALKGFLEEGPESLRRRRPGPAPDLERKEQITQSLDVLLGQDRTWTAAQLAEALRKEGYPLSTRSTRRYLKAMGAKWRRTVRTLSHKQNGERVGRARRVLTTLKRGYICAAHTAEDVDRTLDIAEIVLTKLRKGV